MKTGVVGVLARVTVQSVMRLEQKLAHGPVFLENQPVHQKIKNIVWDLSFKKTGVECHVMVSC